MSWCWRFSCVALVVSVLPASFGCGNPGPGTIGDDCGCDDTPGPVCGVDGRIYDNECRASCNAVEVWHDGPCDPTCRDNSGCASDEYCDFGVSCDVEGTCQPRPQTCERVYDPPVCDCNGVRYNSVCEAHASGVSVSGMCPVPQAN
jgi:hypothetical protein